ncbi:MAG: hypothetical protein PWP72_1437 [Thermoanaerobacter sp.]|jgi:hypothetical protein|nr:hypothetical protein [Thermoanaerobacter sp.]
MSGSYYYGHFAFILFLILVLLFFGRGYFYGVEAS